MTKLTAGQHVCYSEEQAGSLTAALGTIVEYPTTDPDTGEAREDLALVQLDGSVNAVDLVPVHLLSTD